VLRGPEAFLRSPSFRIGSWDSEDSGLMDGEGRQDGSEIPA
jgi:hypothetical protein